MTWWYGQYGAPWREWYNSETGEPWMDDDARASASRRGPGRKGGKGQTPPGGQPPGPEVPVPVPEPVPAWETRRRAERNMAKPRKEPVKNEDFFSSRSSGLRNGAVGPERLPEQRQPQTLLADSR